MPLERQILSAFRVAMRDGRLTVAEHLLQALEALSRECDGALNEAYLMSVQHTTERRAPRAVSELPTLHYRADGQS